MIRVLILDDTGFNAATNWRLYGPFNRISKDYPGEVQVDYSSGRGLPIATLGLFDVIIYYITLNTDITKLLSIAKDMGVKLVLDCDDPVFGADPSSHYYHTTKASQNHYATNFQLADEIWFANEQLSAEHKKIGENRFVITNGVLPEAIQKPKKTKKTNILWRGSHNQILDIHYAERWYKASEDFPDSWRWFGYTPPWVTRDKRNISISPSPPEKYFQVLQNIEFSYLWKPLKPCPQNDQKTNISWLEATVVGTVLVTNYAGGAGWEHCFQTFAAAAEKAGEVWKQSAERIRDEFDLREINKVRVRRLKNLVEQTK